MRYVVGYVASHRGDDAIRLAATLARSRAAALDVVVVLPVQGPTFDMYSPDRAFQAALDEQGSEWLAHALDQIPDDVQATARVVYAESTTEGLISAATDPESGDEAGLIVIGASRHGIFGRFTIGSIASSLLHSSPVPVALATAEYAEQPEISRVTCALGRRAGAEALLEVAIRMASVRAVPLRLMSLVALGKPSADDQARIEEAQAHIDRLVGQAQREIAGRAPVTGVLGTGKTLEDSVSSLDYAPSEVVLVGSSRLAGTRRIFLGTAANKMLRALPVPMIVVPRDYPVAKPSLD